LYLLKTRGVAQGAVTLADLARPPLSLQNAIAEGVRLFGENELPQVVEDLNTHVLRRTIA
jgi:hypothetical protein